MNRITVTLNKEIEQQLRKIQGGLIAGRGEDVNFTTVINTVLLSGIIATDEFSEETWSSIRNFLDNEKETLDFEGLTDHFLNKLK
ncbi:MAG: hypothetical protein K5790_01780 [Nitrosopumilus sp.]|uniref:hypothetical protein n=1 Tax=Nitrosopumilus sp. TaxID=2024843 RepID=UPI00247C1221|nr:hypothetical protein [Nitrosopumilus sp.]MCV0392004.1 hypothetical protein [Nitrosopumilus sp.]